MGFTGRGKVFIRAFSNNTINGVQYTKGEVISYFNNAEFGINYVSNNNMATQAKSIKAINSENIPQQVSITVEGFKRTLWKLIGKDLNLSTAIKPQITSVTSDANGEAFLSNYGAITNLNVINFNTGEKEQAASISVENQSLVENLTASTKFIITYDEEFSVTSSHSIATESIPYLYVEFVQNTPDKDLLIRVPKVGLASTPSLDFNNESIITIPLNFAILDSNIEIYEYED